MTEEVIRMIQRIVSENPEDTLNSYLDTALRKVQNSNAQ